LHFKIVCSTLNHLFCVTYMFVCHTININIRFEPETSQFLLKILWRLITDPKDKAPFCSSTTKVRSFAFKASG
jgi:hypothetical protein